MAVSGNYACVLVVDIGSTGLQVIDISSPVSPRRVGGDIAFAGWNLAVAENMIYAARGDGLVIQQNSRRTTPPIPSRA